MSAEVEKGVDRSGSIPNDDDPLLLLCVNKEVARVFYRRFSSNIDPFPGEDLFVLTGIDFQVGKIISWERGRLVICGRCHFSMCFKSR